MDFDDIRDYIAKKGYARVPEIQKEFNVPYKEARRAVEILEKSKLVEYESGLTYRSKMPNPDDDAEDALLAERRAYLERRRQELLNRRRKRD